MEYSNFTGASFRFLTALAKNNRREWFQPRKAEFEEVLLTPMRDLADLINRELERAAPGYAYAESQKALNRIYRDVRFSADKTPYQDHVSALFPQQRLSKKMGAALYLQVSAGEAMLAGGMYFGETRHLQAVREHLAQHYTAFRKLLSQKPLMAAFGDLHGEQLQKVPKQFGLDHPAGDLLRNKQWMLWRKWTAEEAVEKDFSKQVVEGVRLLLPFVEFLNAPLLELPAAVLPEVGGKKKSGR